MQTQYRCLHPLLLVQLLIGLELLCNHAVEMDLWAQHDRSITHCISQNNCVDLKKDLRMIWAEFTEIMYYPNFQSTSYQSSPFMAQPDCSLWNVCWFATSKWSWTQQQVFKANPTLWSQTDLWKWQKPGQRLHIPLWSVAGCQLTVIILVRGPASDCMMILQHLTEFWGKNIRRAQGDQNIPSKPFHASWPRPFQFLQGCPQGLSCH